MKFTLGIGIASVVLALFAGDSRVDAGYVFLKNGYILQGKITEKDDERVVLDYPGGQVTVFERFIKHVVLDPSEEAATRSVPVEEVAASDDAPEIERDFALPANLSDIVDLGGRRSDPTLAETGGSIGVIDPTPAGGPDVSGVTNVEQLPTPTVDVAALPDPSAPVAYRELGVELQTPVGWTVRDTADVLEVMESEDPGAARMTVQRLVGNQLEVNEATRELKSALLNGYPGVRIVEEEDLQVGFERGRALSAEDPDRSLRFVQVLVRHEDVLYLIGSHWSIDADDTTRELLERSMHSLVFVD